jgi:predicted ATPase
LCNKDARLDNCEHVLVMGAEVAGRLLNDRPQVRMLATSREPLAVADERVERLGPLATRMDGSGQ